MRTTQEEIAKKVGVSRTTVSKVLSKSPDSKASESTRDLILTVAGQLNYKPRVSIRRQKGIVLVLYDLYDEAYTTPSMVRVVTGFYHMASLRGYDIRVASSNKEYRKEDNYFLSHVHGQKADGIIVYDSIVREADLLKLRKLDVPTVFLDRRLEGDRFVSICIDHSAVVRRFAEEMLRKGCRRFALVTGPAQWAVSRQKRRGLELALEGSGARSMVMERGPASRGDHEHDRPFWRGLYKEVITGENHCDAIMADSDRAAAVIIKLCRKRGLRVPEDVSVAAHEAFGIAELFEPTITTGDLPFDRMGELAFEVISNLIEGNEAIEKEYTLRSGVVWRESTRYRPAVGRSV